MKLYYLLREPRVARIVAHLRVLNFPSRENRRCSGGVVIMNPRVISYVHIKNLHRRKYAFLTPLYFKIKLVLILADKTIAILHFLYIIFNKLEKIRILMIHYE